MPRKRFLTRGLKVGLNLVTGSMSQSFVRVAPRPSETRKSRYSKVSIKKHYFAITGKLSMFDLCLAHDQEEENKCF